MPKKKQFQQKQKSTFWNGLFPQFLPFKKANLKTAQTARDKFISTFFKWLGLKKECRITISRKTFINVLSLSL